MMKQRLADCLRDAIAAALDSGEIAFSTMPEIVVERPQDPAHGDFASGIALKLARQVKMNPLELAHIIVRRIETPAEVDSIAVAAPGFINFVVKREWLQSLVDLILQSPESYGNIDVGTGRNLQIEFVSANPTGPLHVGHGRGAVIGSTLASVLAAAGYDVSREYYVNDMGNQIRTFGRSLRARYLQVLGQQAEMPADGYMGDYMIDLAREIVSRHGDRLVDMEAEAAATELAALGTAMMTEAIKDDLRALNVTFDNWFSENSLYSSGTYETAINIVRDAGLIAERENAIWFESSLLGEDKDNVLVRSDGSTTYFASDVAYHYDKFVIRGFDHVIDIWGADHQGHIPRMKAVVKTFGLDPEQLTVLTCQLVTLRRGSDVVRASKRSGDVVTLRELIDEVGSDACRYNFLSRSAESQMDFDIELAKTQSADNPVYYVQYAHARIASIIRNAAQREIGAVDLSLLGDESEMELLRVLSRLPEVIDEVARTFEPHNLPYYAQQLATSFHAFYKQCRVLTDDADLSATRLALARATKSVLSRTLALMGVGSPEQM